MPPASPESPVMAARFQFPAPAPVMSRKSTFEKAVFAAVMVRGIPRVTEVTRILFVALLPFTVKVLVMTG